MHRTHFGFVLVLMTLASLLSVRGAIAPPTSQPTAATPTAVVGLSGAIDDFNRDSFFKRFKTAKSNGAKTIIVEIDTWGGLVTAGLDISRFLKSQNDVHTIAFVNDRAISAGAMIAMACDEIVMRNVATIGDCAPIVHSADGTLQSLAPAERAKMQSPIAADFYESALRNRHDPLLAEAMVVTEVAVYWVEDPDTGDRKFVNQADYDRLSFKGWAQVDMPGVPKPIDTADRLLTMGTDEAVKIGLVSGKAETVEQLAQERNFNIIEKLNSGFGEAAIAWLNSGFVRMLLITVFGAAVYAALHAPGHGTAEALAFATLTLLLGVPLLTGYANWWEILLIIGGLAMIAFEIFVFPHAGLMIIAGLFMTVGGLVMTFVGSEPGGFKLIPHLPGSIANLKHGLGFVTAGMLCSAFLCAWLSRYLPSLPYFSKLVLPNSSSTVVAEETGAAMMWPPIGSVGRAVTPLRPGGSAEFPDATGADVRVFSVVSESGFLSAGAPVVVREVGGGRVVVRSTLA